MKIVASLALIAGIGCSFPALAQGLGYAKVVSSCGGVPYTYSVGDTVPVLIDTHGNLCGGGTATTSTPLTPATVPSGNLTLTAGNTSQTLAAANLCPNFIYISNGLSAADEGGIAATEPVWVNLTSSAAVASPGGASIPVYPGVTQPFVAQSTAITWIATTISHKISAVCE